MIQVPILGMVRDEQHYRSNQSWHYRVVVEIEAGVVLRVAIKRNAYDSQSFTRVDRWNGTEWKVVWSGPIDSAPNMAQWSYMARETDPDDARQDAHDLLARVEEILR